MIKLPCDLNINNIITIDFPKNFLSKLSYLKIFAKMKYQSEIYDLKIWFP